MECVLSIEHERCADFIRRSKDECALTTWIQNSKSKPDLIISEGFEERSVGVLECFARFGITPPKVIVGQYTNNLSGNQKFRSRFENALEIVSKGHYEHVLHENNGSWIDSALRLSENEEVILDITALSSRALFTTLDIAAKSGRKIFITYTEAAEYYPKECEWKRLCEEIPNPEILPATIDQQNWLFGHEHKVEFISNHEGYDSAGSGLALIAFLPFKRARLAAILGEEDYADCLFIAGQPHLDSNSWRLEVLKAINQDIIQDKRVIEMNTFGYRKTLADLSSLLFTNDPILEKYDVHLGILGSKLQGVACWALSCMVPALTVVTSVPYHYYTEAFSEGIGESWIFPLTLPPHILKPEIQLRAL